MIEILLWYIGIGILTSFLSMLGVFSFVDEYFSGDRDEMAARRGLLWPVFYFVGVIRVFGKMIKQ